MKTITNDQQGTTGMEEANGDNREDNLTGDGRARGGHEVQQLYSGGGT